MGDEAHCCYSIVDDYEFYTSHDQDENLNKHVDIIALFVKIKTVYQVY